jgi:hypothetical protein
VVVAVSFSACAGSVASLRLLASRVLMLLILSCLGLMND